MSTSPMSYRDRPCWTCQSYGFMMASDTAFCRNTLGPAVRALASRGCTLFALEPFMDLGDQTSPPAPAPIEWECAQAQRMRDQR